MSAKTKRAATRKPGRPTLYSDELAATICRRLAEGESLRKICANPTMPDKSTVLSWLFDGIHDKFSENFPTSTRARGRPRPKAGSMRSWASPTTAPAT